MPILSQIAQRKKIRYFIDDIPKDARILEVGSGSQWLSNYLKTNNWQHYTGIDINPPADIVGDIRDWQDLGLKPNSFDYIIAFEVVEHLDIFKECYTLLKPNGELLIITPVPQMDWFLKILEALGLNQTRTSPHSHLIDLRNIPYFEVVSLQKIAFLSQWGKFKKVAS